MLFLHFNSESPVWLQLESKKELMLVLIISSVLFQFRYIGHLIYYQPLFEASFI